MISPFSFPVTSETFNFVSCKNACGFGFLSNIVPQAVVIFGAVTIFGIISYFVIPEEKWLPREKVEQALHTADGNPESIDE